MPSTCLGVPRSRSAFATDGWAGGRDFVWLGGDMWRTLGTYSNGVGVGGDPPVGDIFEQVDVTFGLAITQSAAEMDADNIPVGAHLTPVPEPSAVLPMASGLVGVAATGRCRLLRESDVTA